MSYTDDQLRQAGERLAATLQGMNQRLDALDARQQLERMNDEWQSGQAYARRRGYGGKDLERLEQFMVRRGISHHTDAVAIDPAPPERRGFPLAALPDDELALLHKDDTEGFLGLAIRRALSGE